MSTWPSHVCSDAKPLNYHHFLDFQVWDLLHLRGAADHGALGKGREQGDRD